MCKHRVDQQFGKFGEILNVISFKSTMVKNVIHVYIYLFKLLYNDPKGAGASCNSCGRNVIICNNEHSITSRPHDELYVF